MQRFILILLIGVFTLSLLGTEINDIRLQNENGRIIITFNLIGDEPANIIVKAVSDTETVIPGAIAGDIIDVQPGPNKQIWWEPYLEQLNPDEWKIELSIWSGNYIFVPGGEIRFDDNSTVTIKPIYVGKYEVTHEEWIDVMKNSPFYFKKPGNPIENVRWDQVIEFCNKKSEMEGLSPCYYIEPDSIRCDFNADGYRLPFEQEWEFCASGGLLSQNYPYSGSRDVDEVAWYDETSDHAPSLPGQLAPNELGIYDMSGNVKEWCWDDYLKDKQKPFYKIGKASRTTLKVVKGGSWFESYQKCRIDTRTGEKAESRDFRIGLRLFRTAIK
ncbi:MAG: formylglycine-generating enzyme family protein [Candidatus Cloacimonetes bacterium]|nr:formylglycine-generating enzyme family protein [Candidatus Cloacimonadota bacterium]